MKTLFLDMDGVVADWMTGAAKVVGYEMADPQAYYPPEDWAKVRENQRMFRHLPKMKHADQMVDIARKFRDQCGWELLFLTAVPHYNDIHWAFWDKVLWVQDYYPDIPVHFGPYSGDKAKHCKPGDILVDDRPSNIEEWNNAGGRGIEVKFGELNYIAAMEELGQLLYLEQLKSRKY